MTSQPCPDVNRWQSLLDGTAALSEQGELNGHLETCGRCQQALEGLVADRSAWDRTAQFAVAAREPALCEVMAQLKKEDAVAPTRLAAPPEEDDPLDFLTPPNRPGLLGILGRYEILELVGRGGMGVVLKAFDPSLHRIVAIKVLAPRLATSASARKRFQREARHAGCICHDHVMTIHAVEEINGQLCLVMQFVAGISLQEKIDRSAPLRLIEIVQIGKQVAAGLAAAHANGLIHRDVKPANILLENGLERVKITDFGLARAADEASLTSTGVVAGTPQYMAPEQARGEPLDHRADLFSLGSVLYCLATGRLPFRASTTMGVLRKICEDQPPSLHALNPEIPEWLEAIVSKLQAKDPAERFQTATEVADLLGGWLAHLQQPATVPAPMPAQIHRLSPRLPRRRRALLAACLLGLLSLFTISEAFGFTRLVEAAAVALRIRTPDGTLVVEVDDPDVKVSVDGDGVVISGAGVQEIRLKPGTYKLTASKDGKQVQTELVTIKRGDKVVVRMALEPDTQAAQDTNEKKKLQQDLLEARRQLEAERQRSAAALDLAQAQAEEARRQEARARQAAQEQAEQARRQEEAARAALALAERGQTRKLIGHVGPVRALAFTPDSRLLLSGGGQGDQSIRVWDVATGKELRQFQGRTDSVNSVAVSPDGKRALSGSADGTLRVWDLATGKELQRILHTEVVTAVAWLPDGSGVLSGSKDRVVRLWDPNTGEELRTFKGHTGPVTSLAVSPDGQRLASASVDQTGIGWNLTTGKLLWKVGENGSGIYGIAISPDGKQVAAGDGNLTLFDARTGKILRWLVEQEPGITALAFSPGGQRLAAGNQGGTVRLWETTTGKQLQAINDTRELIGAVAFSPDGRWLAVGGGGSGRPENPRPGSDHSIRLYPVPGQAPVP